MGEEIKQLLGEQITKMLRELDRLPPGKERTELLEQINVLYKLMIDEEKIELDSEKFYREKEAEASASKKKQKTEWTFKALDIGVKVLEITVTIGGFILYHTIVKEGWIFEATGAVTSLFTKNHLARAFSTLVKRS